ncbi:ATP/GTP-binding protein [Microcoleus sp.]|uniref:AAA family ATPase n=1 Tax=Microcoleus sp. TaxID=44472 RepID=UPI0035257C8D
MLESFHIDNFRLFKHLEVRKLGRVNLIVGKNNSGKSTFLEALELYTSNASAIVLLDLLKSRQETWFSEAQPHSQNFISNSVRHLFHGHKLPPIGEQCLQARYRSSFTC